MTEISWADVTWNPLVGCSLASPGCTNCYAAKWAARLEDMVRGAAKPVYAGVTKRVNGVPVWTGEVRLAEHKLLDPLGWKKPRLVFVNSMSDMFHEAVPTQTIDRIWAVMGLAEQHTFQVLTKRSGRMRDLLNDPATPTRVAAEMRRIRPGAKLEEWPLRNVWVGVSVEDQMRANERIPDLLDCPAAVRFASAEPLLGRVDLAEAVRTVAPDLAESGLDWVIGGGESGAGARPMHTDWARALRDQCDDAGIAFFFKQVGAWSPVPALSKECIGLMLDGRRVTPSTPGALPLWNVGAKAAGEALDGEKRQSFPTPMCQAISSADQTGLFGQAAP